MRRPWQKCWRRRDGVEHHCGVLIDLDRLPDDPTLLQQMLRDVVITATPVNDTITLSDGLPCHLTRQPARYPI
jgi:hypothetical protein